MDAAIVASDLFYPVRWLNNASSLIFVTGNKMSSLILKIEVKFLKNSSVENQHVNDFKNSSFAVKITTSNLGIFSNLALSDVKI